MIVCILVSTFTLSGCTAESEPANDPVGTTDVEPLAAAQEATAVVPAQDVPAVPVANSFRHRLHSDVIGQDFVIDVALPYTPVDTPMPVVYVTDGNSMFPVVASAARLMQLGYELPPLIIVGIGYDTAASTEILALRTRDLTPTLDSAYVEQDSQGPMPLPDGILPGGAAKFLDFIESEVKPFIAANYPAKTDDSTLLGDSLGGLFTLYALFNRTGDYQRYIAGSPSLWWDAEGLFNDEAAYAARADDLDAEVFISVGALEEDPANPEDFRMVTNTHRLANLLVDRAYPGLNLTTHEFEGETHLSVIPATLSRGLREVFALDVEAMQAAFSSAAAAES
jgi:predicted alpha/beta superfamily hydrolase